MDVKKRLFAASLIVALAAVGTLMNGGRDTAKASPGAAPVNIVNPLPLPTTAAQSGAWNVNVANSPAVSLTGTPTVNANVTFPANQGVTVAAAGPLTNVGRLPSKQVMLFGVGPAICPTYWSQLATDGSFSCFDMANHTGEVLVITDFYWIGTTSPGTTCAAAIVTGSHVSNLYFSSAALADSSGIAAKSEHFTTGITLTANPLVTLGKNISTSLNGCDLTAFPQMTGYLMPNQ